MRIKTVLQSYLIKELGDLKVKKWERFSREEIEQFVKDSKSNREVAKKIGYDQDSGSAMKSLKNMYKVLDIDTSHFTGQGWNKDNYNFDSFTKGTPKKNGKTTLNPLIALRGRKCESCGLEEWLGSPINLEVHHVDGDRLNNALDNLQLLCPNCHSYTQNFRQSSGHIVVSDEDLVSALMDSKSVHQALMSVGLKAASGNYSRAYNLVYKYQIRHLLKQ